LRSPQIHEFAQQLRDERAAFELVLSKQSFGASHDRYLRVSAVFSRKETSRA
jgi:hypothetical protein